MLIADDPFGSLWMVPMVDVLGNIKQELNAAEVRLITKLEAFVIMRNMQEEPPTFAGSFAPALNYVATVRDYSQWSTRMGEIDTAISALPISPGSSGNMRRTEPGRHLIDVVSTPPHGAESVRDVSDLAEHESFAHTEKYHQNTDQVSSQGPYSLPDGLVWFCSHWQDGPHGGWQVSCVSCHRLRENNFIVEETLGYKRK